MPRILVVDDMAVIREPIVSALRANGFDAEMAANGKEALEAMRASPFDVVLLDLTMPVMDGFAFLKAVRADPGLRETAVIPLTSVADRNSIIAVAKLGVRRYLTKSEFSIGDMIETINEALASSAHAGPQTSTVRESETTAMQGDAKSEAPAHGMDDDDPIEALKSLRGMMTRSELLERVEENAELSGMSPTVAQVLSLTKNENVSMDRIAKLIKQDGAIAIKILRLANSSVYSRGQPVDTVDRAITRIGLSQIRQVVLNLAVMEKFSTTEICAGVAAGQFWEHSLACGIIAAEITHARGGTVEDADRAFTMGLVHDLGRAMFARALASDYEKVLDTAAQLRLPLEQVEARLLMLNHADVMDRLLHRWGFPKDLIDPIVFHHLSIGNIRQIAPRRLAEVATLALADRLAHALVIGDSGNATLYPTHELCQALDIGGDVIRRIEETARSETTDLKLGLLSHSSDPGWIDELDACRKRMGEAVRPLFVSEHRETDAFRVFFDQVTAAEEPAAPNIAIAHVTTDGNVNQVARRLGEAEAQAGVRGLPTIVLSPSGRVGLPEEASAPRQLQLLRTPVVLERLLTAIDAIREGLPRREAA